MMFFSLIFRNKVSLPFSQKKKKNIYIYIYIQTDVDHF